MAKWANYLIIGAVFSMIVPFILDYLELLHNHAFWPILSIVLIGVGIIFHVVNGAVNHKLNAQTVLLLLSVLIIVLGFSLSQLRVKFANYLLLAGMILVLLWLLTPNKKMSSPK
jgi:hypothetical protein